MGHPDSLLPVHKRVGRVLLFFGFAGSLLFSGCQKPVYEHTFVANCWEMGDTLVATLPPQTVGDVVVTVELDQDFGYRNLYLRAEIGGAAATTVLLADTFLDESGNWLVERMGKTATVTFSQPLPLQANQQTTVRLYHYMRDSLLCQVHALRLEQK